MQSIVCLRQYQTRLSPASSRCFHEWAPSPVCKWQLKLNELEQSRVIKLAQQLTPQHMIKTRVLLVESPNLYLWATALYNTSISLYINISILTHRSLHLKCLWSMQLSKTRRWMHWQDSVVSVLSMLGSWCTYHPLCKCCQSHHVWHLSYKANRNSYLHGSSTTMFLVAWKWHHRVSGCMEVAPPCFWLMETTTTL